MIIDTIGSLISAFKGHLPDKPDTAMAVFEYDSGQTFNDFCKTHIVYGVQVRSRALSPETAYSNIMVAAATLNRYNGTTFTVLQKSPIIDIGNDTKGRREYTVNFTVRCK